MPFLVVQSAELSPNLLTVVVKGSTLPLLPVTATLTPSGAQGTAIADAAGNYTITIIVPQPPTPPYTVDVASGGEVVADVPVTQGP